MKGWAGYSDSPLGESELEHCHTMMLGQIRGTKHWFLFQCGAYISVLSMKHIACSYVLTLFYLTLAPGNSNMVMALTGNKADLLDARKVAAEVSIFHSSN